MWLTTSHSFPDLLHCTTLELISRKTIKGIAYNVKTRPNHARESGRAERIRIRSTVSGWCALWVSTGEIILQKNRLVHTKAKYVMTIAVSGIGKRRSSTHVILMRCMKKFIRPLTILIISLFLALTVVAFSATNSTGSTRLGDYSGANFFFQITTTPQPVEDRSEIGSTDGLTLLSFIIVTIIVIPIFLKRKNWSQT